MPNDTVIEGASIPIFKCNTRSVACFALYQELRSVGKVVKAFRAAGLLFPRRRRGHLCWEPITRDRVYDLLTNEHYTDAYTLSPLSQVHPGAAQRLCDAIRPPGAD
jgi:hypothetical protein